MWMCKDEDISKDVVECINTTNSFQEDVHFYKEAVLQCTWNILWCLLFILRGWLIATFWPLTSGLPWTGIFRSLLTSTSAVKQKAADGTPAAAAATPLPSPALGSSSQYNVPGEWITLMSHCFLNCPPASRAIKPKQNNRQRLLHLCSAPAGCRERYSTADNGGMPNAFLALKKQFTAPCRLALKLVLQFHPQSLHVVFIHTECCNSVKVRQKSKPQKC